MKIEFQSEYDGFEVLAAGFLKKWICKVIEMHGAQSGRINYRFCDDETVWRINVDFLNHDTYTDIITFDSVVGKVVSGDIVISVDRVAENARRSGADFEKEMLRVIIHGVLHLLGFKDKTDSDAAEMRRQEDSALLLLGGEAGLFHVERRL